MSKACKIVGYSRQQFYEIRRNFQLYGAEGLIDQLPGPKGPHPNRVSEEIEQAVLAHALEAPTHGAQRVAGRVAARRDPGELRRRTGQPAWPHHEARTAAQARRDGQGTEAEADRRADRAAGAASVPSSGSATFEVHYPGDLVAVDTFFVGTLKGVGKVYLQTVLVASAATPGAGSTRASSRSRRCR